MIDVSKYIGKQFHPTNYNCFHFVQDVYKDLFNIDIDILNNNKEYNREYFFTKYYQEEHKFQECAFPEENSIVWMEKTLKVPHVGILSDKHVLHLGVRGVKIERLNNVLKTYDTVRFYKWLKSQ